MTPLNYLWPLVIAFCARYVRGIGLGTIGMGEVYRASDPRLGRDVAIKVLPEATRASPERGARFEREFDVAEGPGQRS